MDHLKWNNVLIEWVNCLKLGKNINSLDQLRDGEFFSNLQKLITKSRNAQVDLLTFIFDLFSKHYPNYLFENKTDIHLFDLPEIDLKALTSLLMHYTCIYDRRDVLTSPLCHSLSQTTQLIIRNFLQKITKNVTKDTMNDIIKSCIDDASDHLPTNQWLSVETTCSKNSPLQDLLKTPVSKFGRLYEKDKLISTLKSELEAERYEKADLQEELKLQSEKSKKIEQQLQQKNNEISRLRAEVIALENRTPPHFQDMDSRELQRRLRSEIQTLEQYIKQIEDEQEDIRKEKDATKERLRNVEMQAGIWEEKFFETERNFESLTEHSKKQEEELRQLNEHCAELTSLLEEYRAKPGNDSSLFEMPAEKVLNETAPCDEDLACSVIEVQLRDAHKQVEELKGQVGKTEECLEKLRGVLDETEATLKEAQGINKDLNDKVKSLETEKETNLAQLTVIQSNLDEANNNVKSLENEVATLTTKLQESNTTLEIFKQENEGLISTVNSLRSDIANTDKQLTETLACWEQTKLQCQSLENDLDESKLVSEKLQFELADAVLENQKINKSLSELINEKEGILCQLNETEHLKKTLEMHLFELQEYSKKLETECEGFRQELDDKNMQLLIINQEKSNLTSKLQYKYEQLNDLQNTHERLNSEMDTLQIQLKETLDRLDSSQKLSLKLQDECSKREKKLHEAKTETEDLTSQVNKLLEEKQVRQEELTKQEAYVKDLENEKNVLETELNNLEETHKNLLKKNEELQSCKADLEKQISELLNDIETSTQKVERLLKIQKSLESELQESQICSNSLRNEMEQIKKENGMINLKLQETDSNLTKSETQNKNLQLQTEKLSQELCDSINNLRRSQEEAANLRETKNKLEKDLKEVEAKSEKLVVELSEKNKDIEELTEVKNELTRLGEKSKEEKSSLESEIANLKQQLANAFDKLEVLKTEEERLENIKNELELKLNEAQLIEEKRKVELVKLKDDLLKSHQENTDLAKKLDVLEQENTNLITESQKLQQKLSQVLSDLELKTAESKQMNDIQATLETRLEEAEKMKLNLEAIEAQLKETQNDHEELKKEKVVLEIENANMEKLTKKIEEKLHETEGFVKDLEIQNKDIINQLEDTKKFLKNVEGENGALSIKQRILEREAEDLREEKMDLQKQLYEERNNFEEMNVFNRSLQRNLEDLHILVDTLQSDKQKLNEDLMNERNENEALILKLNEKCEQLEDKLCDYVDDLENVTKELEMVRIERNLVEITMEELKSELKTLENSHEVLEVENKSLNQKLKQLEEESNELKNKNEALEKDRREIEESSAADKTEIEKLLKLNEDVQNQLLLKERNYKELRNDKEILDKQLNEMSVLSETLKAESEGLRLQYQNTKLELDETRDMLTKLTSEKENLFLLLQQAKEQNGEFERQFSEMTNLIRIKEDKCNELNSVLQELEDNKKVLISEKGSLQKCIAEIEEKSMKEKEELSLELSRISDEKISLENKIKVDEIVSQETRDILMKLTFEKENLFTLLQQAKEQNADFEKQISEMKNMIGIKEDKCKELNDALQKLEDSKKVLISEKDSLQNCIAEIEEKSMKEKEELSLELSRISNEKISLENKIEVDEIVSQETHKKIKLLEETIQDYEITISGLKSVVDTNLESLESLKEELAERKNKESETVTRIFDLLKDNNLIDKEEGQGDFRTFISEHFERLLSAKKQVEQLRRDLKIENEELKAQNMAATKQNANIQEMVEKLYGLVMEERETGTSDTLKSSLEQIYTEVNSFLHSKQKLLDDLNQLKNEKTELTKKLDTIMAQKEEIHKTKSELEENLKEEKERVENLRKELATKSQTIKIEKENILGMSTKSNKSREEDMKKENMMLKRKLVLADNAKNNLEKVVKELREEKRKAQKAPSSPSNDVLYKKLLQEYIQVKEENERVVKEKDARIEELSRANQEMGIISVPIKDEGDKKIVQDLQNIREAYGNVMSVNSKLEMENVTLRKIIEERNSELGSLNHIKEAYEKLLEENNKVMTEIDTIKYKRMRDKEEFVRLIKKDRDEFSNRETKKIQEIRNEYEGKLEKMKEKMLKLYREEVNKKVRSMKDGHSETANLMKTVANLKSDLFEADQKIQLLEMEKQILKTNRRIDSDAKSQAIFFAKPTERAVTLPRPSITEEVTVSRRTSISGIPNLQMEDEEDLFNEKYLTDLKEGKCLLPSDRESNCRFSELAWRNSMVPPHLKSSYPAETQFVSPNRFKDEDIKASNIEFEDSLCKLLPGEKPRKKDFGTTSYKKPGPPTPSKNGGRLSLQGNEIHPMRDVESKTPKRSTPSRIKALFTGRNSSTREESHNGTPNRGRRLTFFRRPR